MTAPPPDARSLVGEVVRVDPCGDDAVILVVRSEPELPPIRASRFFMLKRLDRASPLIPRPFSIYRQRDGLIEFLVKVVGRGTRALAACRPGQELSLIGPLGNGWPTLDGDGPPWVFVAGGVGLTPVPRTGRVPLESSDSVPSDVRCSVTMKRSRRNRTIAARTAQLHMLVGQLWKALRHPVHPDTRSNLARLWAELPESLQRPDQLYGRQWEGCGATLGAMPRCDFGCTACYLGPEANGTPAASLDELREQLRLIRSRVGRFGNVQLTDGEVTLRPLPEVLELVRTARKLELIPMLMTHGDSFRRDPTLLEKLVVEGGLTEICVHVDTTQRGRLGFGSVTHEAELHPVRDELANIVRDLRRRTGCELRVAGTVTVTRSNVDDMPDVVRWMLANSDVFRVLSFQPVADVGRTRDSDGVSREELWDRVADGLGEKRENQRSAWNSPQLFGHPSCSHVVMGAVWNVRGRASRFLPLRDPTNAWTEAALDDFFERFGGISFRNDGRAEALARMLGAVAHAPGLWLRRAPRFVASWLKRLEPDRPLRAVRLLGTGRGKLRALALVSHHFMDRATLETDVGKEREAACVFRVPFRGKLVSMCRVNATGLRGEYYRELAREAT